MEQEDKPLTLYQLERDLLEELEDMKKEIKEAEYPTDYLREIVDGYVPIYNSDLLDLAKCDLWLAVDIPEIYAFNGEHTAVNAIAGNVYEHLADIAYKWAEENGIED